MEQGVAFGLRQLVDNVESALPPGISDPTTAWQALGELHDRELATRHLAGGGHRDGDGAARLLTRPIRFADHLPLAQDEVEQYGQDSTQVQGLIDALLADLSDAALTGHRPEALAPQCRRGTTGAGSPAIGQAPSRAKIR